MCAVCELPFLAQMGNVSQSPSAVQATLISFVGMSSLVTSVTSWYPDMHAKLAVALYNVDWFPVSSGAIYNSVGYSGCGIGPQSRMNRIKIQYKYSKTQQIYVNNYK